MSSRVNPTFFPSHISSLPLCGRNGQIGLVWPSSLWLVCQAAWNQWCPGCSMPCVFSYQFFSRGHLHFHAALLRNFFKSFALLSVQGLHAARNHLLRLKFFTCWGVKCKWPLWWPCLQRYFLQSFGIYPSSWHARQTRRLPSARLCESTRLSNDFSGTWAPQASHLNTRQARHIRRRQPGASARWSNAFLAK